MTAQKSTAKNNYFMVNFRNRLKSNMKTSIIITILHILAVPMVLLQAIISWISEENYQKAYLLALKAVGGNDRLVNYDALPKVYDFNEAYIFIGFLALGIAILSGILIALSNFSYLYKKTQVDMIYSLPLTTTQRFMSDFFAGVTSYIAPFIASGFLTLILCFVGRATIVDWVNTFPDAGFGFQTVGQLLFQCYLYGTFVLLMVYTISVLVISCCGNIVESGIYIFATNILIPSTIAVFTLILFGDLYGIDVERLAIKAICPTSPFGAFISFVDVIDTVEYGYGGVTTMFDVIVHHLLPFIFFTVLYGVIAFFLYKNRKAEDVSKPFVYKLFYYIISTAVVFCIVSIFIGENGLGGEGGLLPLLIISGIVFFIMDIIANRGFRKFWVSVIRFVATMVVMIVAVSLVGFTGGFGMVKYVPNASSISSVSINSYSHYGRNNRAFIFEYEENGQFTIKNDELIKAVIDAHEANVNRYSAMEEVGGFYKDTVSTVDITYVTNFGRKISRANLELNESEAKMLNPIYSSDEYREQAFAFIDKAVSDIEAKGVKHSEYSCDFTGVSKNGTDMYFTSELKDELLVAMKNDIANYNGEELIKANYGYVSLNVNSRNYDNGHCYIKLPLSEQFPETLDTVTKLYPEFGGKDFFKNVGVSQILIRDYTEDGDAVNVELPENFVKNAKLKKAFEKVMEESVITDSYRSYGGFVIEINGLNYAIEDCEEARSLYEYAIKGASDDATYVDGAIHYYYYNDEYGDEYAVDFTTIEEARKIIKDIVFEEGYVTYFEIYGVSQYEKEGIESYLWSYYSEIETIYHNMNSSEPAVTSIVYDTESL